MREIYVEQNQQERLDVFLAACTGFSRSYIKQLIDSGHILLNQKTTKASKTVALGDKITIDEPIKNLDIIPQDIPLDIIYQDSHIAIINKQQGLSVHPAGGAVTNTLVNALLYHFSDLSKINGVIRPGIVHRLDKDTSGVMVIAKNDKAHLCLSRQLSKRKIKKVYIALLEGVLKDDSGTIETYIGRHKTERKKMAVLPSGRLAITHYKVIKRFAQHTLVEFDLVTGRTHQIRVHSRHIRHPIVGDKLYGYKKQKFNLDGQLLHSYKIGFTHPNSKKWVEFTAKLPENFKNVLKILNSKEN